MNKPLPWILLSILLTRILFSFYSIGFEHPNEFARTLEPIASEMGYSSRLPWEWKEGLLSKVPILIQKNLIQGIEQMGFGPLGSSIGLRIFLAFLSMLPLFATLSILKLLYVPLPFQIAGLLYLGFWPGFFSHSVRIMDYSWEAALYGLAIWWFLRAKSPRAIEVSGAALSLSLSFFFRPQSGLLFLALSIFSFSVSSERKKLWVFVPAYILGLVLIGCLESGATHEPFLSFFFNYWNFNWTEGGASKLYGSDPFFRYLSECAKFYGWIPFLALLFGAFQKGKARSLLGLWLFPLLILSLVSHKEGRFILGFAWALIPLGVAGLSQVSFPPKTMRTLLVFIFISFALELHRDSPKWALRRNEVKEFSRNPAPAGQPIYVVGDPDFLPGGFFLRTRETLEYRNSSSEGVERGMIFREEKAGVWEYVPSADNY